MLTDIFSSLDAGTYSNFSVSGFVWLSGFMGLFVVFMGVWMSVSSISITMLMLADVVLDLVKSCSGKFFGGFALGQVSLFMLIFLVNIFGMIPNVFSPTSHLSLTLVLAMMVWFSLMLSGWVYSWKESAGHLVPTGSPIGLIPLLVMIESVSILIRPVTLGVRLAANITMGHLMLHVIGEYVVSFFYGGSFIGSLLGSVVIWGYVIFEFAVSFLQAYVFVLLVGLYSSDHPMGY
uniref:ATP synthase subunit a n=1 Tax=Anemina arcaeformis TaxID=1903496 RepID=A0A0C4K4F1_9BIVA|nr:ATP synthase F0 subunit 6 [Anodonta arcaeformis]AHJ59892.1 ATP synthase F0 subunit 6 [Anodonta arcaeformis]